MAEWGWDELVVVAGVDDTTAVTQQLTDAGFEVREAATWDAASEYLDVATCVVIGSSLPDCTALDVLDEYAGVGGDVPIIVCDDAVDEATALDAGAADYVDPRGVVDVLRARVERACTQRQSRRTLERDASILDSLLTHIPVSVYAKDEAGRHVRVSDSIVGGPDEHILNEEGKVHPTPQDLIGKTDFDLYHHDGAVKSRETEDHVLDTEESVDDVLQEFPAVEPHGWRVYTLTSKAPWYDHDGGLAGIVGVTRDITQRKTYEKRIERQNERLDRFAGAISHDLRNPLNVAQGNLELVRSDVDHPRLDGIDIALDRMAELIDDVLTLAKEGKAIQNPEPVELDAIARAAWETVDTADATLTIETDDRVLADETRLQRLLENLFRNAIEHAGPEVAVTVGTDGYVLYVEDDGPGVPEDDREHVFTRGFTTNDDGTGYGLQIVTQIASAHDWTVEVTDGAAGGARFELQGVQPATD